MALVETLLRKKLNREPTKEEITAECKRIEEGLASGKIRVVWPKIGDHDWYKSKAQLR